MHLDTSEILGALATKAVDRVVGTAVGTVFGGFAETLGSAKQALRFANPDITAVPYLIAVTALAPIWGPAQFAIGAARGGYHGLFSGTSHALEKSSEIYHSYDYLDEIIARDGKPVKLEKNVHYRK
jgi:hypothetical protein